MIETLVSKLFHRFILMSDPYPLFFLDFPYLKEGGFHFPLACLLEFLCVFRRHGYQQYIVFTA